MPIHMNPIPWSIHELPLRDLTIVRARRVIPQRKGIKNESTANQSDSQSLAQYNIGFMV